MVHKDVEALRSSGFNTTDIKKDIASMEEEKEQLVKRVERLKKKVLSAKCGCSGSAFRPLQDCFSKDQCFGDQEVKFSKQG